MDEYSDPRPIATVEQFKAALLAVRDTGRVFSRGLELVVAHYRAPSHTISSFRLAKELGYPSFSPANLFYGKFARRVADALGRRPGPFSSGKPHWWRTLANGKEDSLQTKGAYYEWILRPEFARALEELGWTGTTPDFTAAVRSAQPVVGGVYSWSAVQQNWFGEQTYLAKRNGRIVCATLTREHNPLAPEVILVGKKPKNMERGELLCEQGGAIPIFIRAAQNEWQYHGQFEVERFTTNPAELRLVEAGEKSALSRVIFLRKVSETPETAADIPDVDNDVYSGTEGRKIWELHLRRERDGGLPKAKKARVLKSNGCLECEACGFNFKTFYPPHDLDFCEVHHRKPLAELDEGAETTLEDLAILCSNCHRAIHRIQPMLTVERLKWLIYVKREKILDTEGTKKHWDSAEQGDAVAQSDMGDSYYFGEPWSGFELDFTQAVKWYRRAAGQNHAHAQYQLGVCYYYGEGVEQDRAEAVKWLRRSAEQNHSRGALLLGESYFFGGGVDQDHVEAVKWWRKAARKNLPDAQFNLAACYEEGKGLEKDYVEAYAWYCLAAQNGADNDNYGTHLRGRDELEKQMSPRQLGEALKRTKELRLLLDSEAM